jgi:carbon storage regulator CsrA
MLILKREAKQTIVVDGPCVIEISEIGSRSVKVAIEGPRSTKILRGELVPIDPVAEEPAITQPEQ